MGIPHYQPCYLPDLDALRAEGARLGLDLPLSEDSSALAQDIAIGPLQAANRFCIQPITGNDAEPDGAPGQLTCRRYRRFARGGAALIWVESTAAGTTPAGAAGLALHDGTLEAFRTMLAEMREDAAERWGHDIIILLQIAPRVAPGAGVHQLPNEAGGGGATLLSDSEIDGHRESLIATGVLAAEAGFDGVDVQSCRGALAGALLGASTREGEYGGSFENRTRFLTGALAGIRSRAPDLVLATRLCAYDAVRSPYGFGVDAGNYREIDLGEPLRLVGLLRDSGLDLLNSTVASPSLAAPAPERAFHPKPDGELPDEHPLNVLDRQLRVARALREAAPGMPIVGSGFSWLRGLLPQVAAGAIGDGAIDFVGLGRGALADPDAPAHILEQGRMDPAKTCMVCFACNQLRDEQAPVGCPIRDPEIYGAEYRAASRFAPDHLAVDARRCHLCEAAPCISASRTGTDIPSFIRAYREGDESRAYEIIRKTDPLPEMTAQLTPGWLHSEGACIETALSGNPIPILDLQYSIAWAARQRGETGVRLPDASSGKKFAIVGGGPTGIAAAITLLERGHEVDLFEHSDALGGTPARVIPSDRLQDTAPEIGAILNPAIECGRLRVRTGMAIGENLQLSELQAGWDATLLATGLWQEDELEASGCEGVVDALTFLERAKRGDQIPTPHRAAVLAGGDCAMDVAVALKKLGAEELFIVFGGPRSDMHWHMPEDWFATPGVHAMMQCRPLRYALEEDGGLAGLHVHHEALDRDSVLPVDMVVRAMGLGSAPTLRAALSELAFTEDGRMLRTAEGFRTGAGRVFAAGGLINGGASVSRCVAEGAAAAEQIHSENI